MADIPSSRLSTSQLAGGAIKLNGLQSGWTFNTGGASPGETAVIYSITTTLAQAMSVDVPAGKQMVLDYLYVPLGLSTVQLLTAEIDIDGVTVISSAATTSTSQLYFIGSANDPAAGRLLVNSNFKLRIRTATTTQTSISFVYRYYLI